MVGDLGIALVADRGWTALTPATLADAVGLTRQAVHQWFGDQHRLRLTFAQVFAGRWERWIDVRLYAEGPAGLLPSSEDSHRWSRVWLALVGHGACDPEIAAVARHLHAAQTTALAHHLVAEARRTRQVAVSPLPPLTDAVAAAVDGLRVQVCLGLDAPVARRALEQVMASSWETLFGALA